MVKNRAYAVFVLPVMLVTLVLAAGCGSKEPVQVDPDAIKNGLIGKVWICESLFERPVAGDNPLTLEFMPDGKVKGSGGCNTFTGEYYLASESLTFGPLAATKKYCGAAAGEQEYTYMTFLARIKKVKVDDDEMELYGDDTPVPMSFSTDGGGGLFW